MSGDNTVPAMTGKGKTGLTGIGASGAVIAGEAARKGDGDVSNKINGNEVIRDVSKTSGSARWVLGDYSRRLSTYR